MIDKKLDFLCIGAQKSGTTSLHDILVQHPEIALPKNKETHFFSHEDIYTEDIEDYYKMFTSNLSSDKVIGEIDPEYLPSKLAYKRLYKNFGPNIKFIVILRNPFDRAYSQYLMSKRRGFEPLGFKESIEAEKGRINDQFSDLYHSYSTRSLYTPQIKKYLELFDLSNFLFIRFEDDFLDNKSETIDRITTFLGLPPFNYNLNIESNRASVPKSKLVRDFVDKPGIIRKYGKHLVPFSGLRRSIINKIDHLNRKKISYAVNESLKKELIENLFLEDIKELESLTKLNLSRWYKTM
ncbi:sulfotransferase family protein [Winogradskyella wichelsiae]|uniref:sulfotransferase family protein n=1 Tax=Winogradskyella wichelsiae TaxID=2697007 RepID=UPI0015CE35C1|nr:sulfotransferase [Winogradskyella wichelsiae]